MILITIMRLGCCVGCSKKKVPPRCTLSQLSTSWSRITVHLAPSLPLSLWLNWEVVETAVAASWHVFPRLNAAASASKRTGKWETKAACLPPHREKDRCNPETKHLQLRHTSMLHGAEKPAHSLAVTLQSQHVQKPQHRHSIRDPLLVSFW